MAGTSSKVVTRQVLQFALVGIVAAAIVVWATAVASGRVGEREAVADARTTTLIIAEGLVEPLLTDAFAAGDDPAASARLNATVRRDVLSASLVRTKVWRADGTILYSDEPRVAGQSFALGGDEVESLTSGRIEAEVSDLTKPENRFERELGTELLEVYLPVHTPGGEPLLFEAYYRLDDVQDNGSRLWRSFAPISLGALVMLELVQLPLAWSLARRLRQRLQERERLLQRALDASEVERRQIASDLHDGVVQDLAGVAFALSARARRGEDERDLEAMADTVRESIRALRSLVVDLYPPNLREEGLASALQDLVERVAARGVVVTVDTTALVDPVPDAVAGLLYRSAQEGLRNVAQHAGASTVTVTASTERGSAKLRVVDDGRGFDDSTLAAREAEGHLGLKALGGLVSDSGGVLAVRSSAGAGTTLEVELPLP